VRNEYIYIFVILTDNQINNEELGRSCIKSGEEVAFIHFSRIWAVAVPVIHDEYLQCCLKGIATFLYCRAGGWVGYVQLFGGFSGSSAVLRYVYLSRKQRGGIFPVLLS
jgi:hypothetical protein